MLKNKNRTTPRYLTEGDARELIDEVVRAAVRDQARTIEQHLKSIHERISSLEGRRTLGR
jgi:hypothetical protein